jgi:maltose O-acetyltransferase
MILSLWKRRSRPPFGSRLWWRTWAKRTLHLPSLLSQAAIHLRLKRHRAQIAPSSFIASTKGFSANLAQLQIGPGTFVGRVELSVVAPITIGASVCINDGAKLLTGTHDVSDPGWRSLAGPITVSDYAWIGTNALLLPGVTIGMGAVVGAGAVVSKDIPAFTIAVGNPVRILTKERCRDLQYNPAGMAAVYAAWLPSPNDRSKSPEC